MDFKVYKCPISQKFFDPFEILRRLHQDSQGKVNEWIKTQDDPINYGNLVDLGRKVFGLSAVNPNTGVGFLEPDVFRAVEAFSEYTKKKVNGDRESLGFVNTSIPFPPPSARKNCLP